MTTDTEENKSPVERIVGEYLKYNTVAPTELPKLINEVQKALGGPLAPKPVVVKESEKSKVALLPGPEPKGDDKDDTLALPAPKD